MLYAPSTKTIGTSDEFIESLPSAVPFSKTLETKLKLLPKTGKDPKFPQHLCSVSLLSTTGKLFEKVILKIAQRHIEERGRLNASHFGFCTNHSTTFQYMRLTGHVTLNFSNNMSTTAVFLGIEKAFDKTQHLGLLYKLSELNFLITLIRLISSFLSQRKFRVLIEGKLFTPRGVRVPQGSILSPTFYSLYINYMSQTLNAYLGLFANDTCIYATDSKEGFIMRKCACVYACNSPKCGVNFWKPAIYLN
jgi:hypothetical protein